MIHYTNHNGFTTLKIDGNLDMIIADTAYMILLTYKALLEKKGCAAEIYREYFENHSKDIFDFDDANKKGTENIGSCKIALDELLNALESIKKNKKKGGDENA